MKNICSISIAIVLTAGLVGCGPKTKLVADWKSPDYAAEPFKKLVSIAITKDSLMSRIAEDEFVRNLPKGTEGISGYRLIPEESRGNVEEVKKILKDAGVDGAVVFRLVGKDQKMEFSPGTPYYSFYGYYGWAWSTTHVPDYINVQDILKVEATVYSIANEKIVWSAQSETTDPNSARQLVDDVARLVAKRMQRAGLLGS